MRAIANPGICYPSELLSYLYAITATRHGLHYGEQVDKKGPVAPNLQISGFQE